MHILLFLWALNFQPPKVINTPFPKGDRRDTTNNYIVLHYDASMDFKQTFRWLKRKRNSYHYFIRRDGTIHKLIDPKYQANHAGLSYWDGNVRMNRYSIGVCLQNDGKVDYTDKQYQSLQWLINTQKKRFHDITDEKIIGHSDIAIPRGRKSDPGDHFDWSRIGIQRTDGEL
jgi:N-acetylmuramoyl-L-alanine amidase